MTIPLPNGCLVTVRYVDGDDMALVTIIRNNTLLASDIVDRTTIEHFIQSYTTNEQ